MIKYKFMQKIFDMWQTSVCGYNKLADRKINVCSPVNIWIGLDKNTRGYGCLTCSNPVKKVRGTLIIIIICIHLMDHST